MCIQASEALQNSMVALVDNQKLLDELYNFRVNIKLLLALQILLSRSVV